MKKVVLFLLVIAGFAVAQGNREMFNSLLMFEDSLRLDSTESKFTKAIWRDNYDRIMVVIAARNDSTAGFASDSAAAKIELYQVAPITSSITNKSYPSFVVLKSRAHPDSATLPTGGAQYVLWDSLDVKSMDTACVYTRNVVTNAIAGAGNGQIYRSYGDSLKTLSQTGYGAFTYWGGVADFSPAIALKFTGKLTNGKRGVGSVWKVRVYGLRGVAVR